MKPYTVERPSRRQLWVRHHDVAPGFERRHLLISDTHYDHPHSDRDLLHRHYAQAAVTGAGIFVFGDIFDAKQGPNSPHSSKDALGIDYLSDDYHDLLIDKTADQWRPWADQIELLAFGNHEGAIRKHHNINLLRSLARRLRVDDHWPQWFGFSGDIRFFFRKPSGGERHSVLLYFHHGAGGSAPVTRGAIKTNRRSVAHGDPDIIVSGHIHQKFAMYTPRIVRNNAGKTRSTPRLHLQCGTYLDPYDFDTDALSWSDQAEMDPPLLGGWWLIFRYQYGLPGNVAITFEPAI